ncbi:hypothetical protein A9264_07015 [Vibrio sp. UCD-FRSSP16_10]|uniref:DMT family transporter n=1 Tax=unclassified Vibrio TaxID=2614977 RepID=UPI0007FFF1D4|nr:MULTISPECIES: DMT family transporter [unclassified Vibrio]OBT13492.1 hypothetical protein A9264_07015 [Vibrio sp. UCD-FRSSP16_10]OBT18012.1 hypothetical protein A9260_01005 [Vibrio sp. UCD-FRSSP16_30]
MQILLLTTLAMMAFAANSLFSRLALVDGAVSAQVFTLVRILSGAITLSLILLLTSGVKGFRKQWRLGIYSGVCLFSYALLFSVAYTQLTTGTGALILFGAVQFSLLGAHLLQGQRIRGIEMLGIALSFIGFIYLVNPSSNQFDFWPIICMLIAGLSWAGFTLLGKRSDGALGATTKGFIIASVLSLGLLPWLFNASEISSQGILYGVLSGAIMSGAGYVLWYAIVPKISLINASLAQLTVPAIALLMGAVFLDESLTMTTLVTMLLILGGIALTLYKKPNSQKKESIN